MIKSISIDFARPESAVAELLSGWNEIALKVFVLQPAVRPRTEESVQYMYGSILDKIGTPCAFAEDVALGAREQQRTGEIWMDVRYDPNIKDAYRHSANAQPLHTDGSYVEEYPNSTIMVCEANAIDGGETTFIDGSDLVEVLDAEAPELLSLLKSTIVPHARSGDRRDLPIVNISHGHIFLNWNYYCVDTNASPEVMKLRELFHRFLLESPSIGRRTQAVKLSRGDAVIWKDQEILHGRNAFHATKVGDRFLRKCALDVGVW
jgi:alpha-ketoglutarate-dependent taurine dioxygenase